MVLKYLHCLSAASKDIIMSPKNLLFPGICLPSLMLNAKTSVEESLFLYLWFNLFMRVSFTYVTLKVNLGLFSNSNTFFIIPFIKLAFGIALFVRFFMIIFLSMAFIFFWILHPCMEHGIKDPHKSLRDFV